MPAGLKEIGSNAFQNCTALDAITIPEDVTKIGSSAFQDCTALSEVTLPAGLEEIGSNAFQNCASLTAAGIPSNVTKIGGYAFRNSGLTSVSVPGSVTSMGTYVFQNCTALTSAAFDHGVTVLPDYALYGCTALSKVTLPATLTEIGANAFNGCTALTVVTIPSGVTKIGNSAFQKSGLTSVSVPGSVTSMGTYVFRNCTALTSATLGEGITVIPISTFYGCTELAAVTLPDSVTTINSSAFGNCRKLVSLTIRGDVPTSVNSYAFPTGNYLAEGATLYYPAAQEAAWKAAADADGKWKGFTLAVLAAVAMPNVPEGAADYTDMAVLKRLQDAALEAGITDGTFDVFRQNSDGTVIRELLTPASVEDALNCFNGLEPVAVTLEDGTAMVVLPYTFDVCGISVEASEVVVTVKVESGLPKMPLTFAEGIAYAIVPTTEGTAPAVTVQEVAGDTATLAFTPSEGHSTYLFKASVSPRR